jgi:hypothetical protein
MKVTPALAAFRADQRHHIVRSTDKVRTIPHGTGNTSQHARARCGGHWHHLPGVGSMHTTLSQLRAAAPLTFLNMRNMFSR